MTKPSKAEILDYVADMSEQLAAMCCEHDWFVSALLRYASRLARRPQPDIGLIK